MRGKEKLCRAFLLSEAFHDFIAKYGRERVVRGIAFFG